MFNFISIRKISTYLICSAILYFPIKLNSQNFDKINSLDTIYIYFKKNNSSQIKSLAQINSKNYNYSFFFDVENVKQKQYFTLYSYSPLVKKNKNIIINYDYLNSLGFFEAEKFLLSKKKIYVIDYNNIRCFKIKCVEVTILSKEHLIPIE